MDSNLTLLLRSFDETLSPDDQNRLDQALSTSPELRKQREELLAVRSYLASKKVTDTDKGFTNQVLARLDRKPSNRLETQVWYWFPRIATASLLFMGFALAWIYFSESALFPEYVIGLEEEMAAYSYTLIEQ